MLTRSGLGWSALSVLLGAALGAVLLGWALPLWLVLGVLILLLAVAGWQLPWIRACLPGVPLKVAGQQAARYWVWRVLVVLLLITLGVLTESVWWVQHAVYKDSTYDGTDENGHSKYKEGAEYTLPLHYALKKPLWELGLIPLPHFVNIPAGSFQMGSDQDDDEKPVHSVSIPTAFAMSQTEVTFAQYDYYVWRMRKAGLEHINYLHDEGWGRDDRPVINVSWEDANAYANWLSQQTQLSCRLPSEAEWEYAARAGTNTAYFWSDELGKGNANCADCGSEWDSKSTAPVGRFKANALGLLDMHGNVYEWVQDRWHNNYAEAPVDGSAWELDEDNSGRVLRGGSWRDPAVSLRSAYRIYLYPVYRLLYIGFRVVCSSPSER